MGKGPADEAKGLRLADDAKGLRHTSIHSGTAQHFAAPAQALQAYSSPLCLAVRGTLEPCGPRAYGKAGELQLRGWLSLICSWRG